MMLFHINVRLAVQSMPLGVLVSDETYLLPSLAVVHGRKERKLIPDPSDHSLQVMRRPEKVVT